MSETTNDELAGIQSGDSKTPSRPKIAGAGWDLPPAQHTTEELANQASHPLLTPNAQRPVIGDALDRIWRRIEGLFDVVYTSNYNPLHRSGAIAILLFGVALVTGVWLFLMFSTAFPYESIKAMHEQWWGGRWIRSLHRYAADAAMVMVLIHIAKVFVSGKTWGPRAMAWISGIFLVGLMLICGWSGIVMLWDTQGMMVALELAKMVDLFPVLSEPIARSFAGDQAVMGTFFFLNLFLHVAMPLGLAGGLWIHTSRVARPALLPPKKLGYAVVGGLTALAMLKPLTLLAPADALEIPGVVQLDIFYSFWIPIAREYGPTGLLTFFTSLLFVAVSVPWWWRPALSRRSGPSFVDERRCEGCMQCYLDCPYDAIDMVKRENRRDDQSAAVARVSPDVCVRCGICSGSCDPMSVGPPNRTGKDQLRRARNFIQAAPFPEKAVVVVGCSRASVLADKISMLNGFVHYPVDCAGSVHSTIIEYILRRGGAGVVVWTCPPRDCNFREGPKWVFERLFRGREAKLRENIDKRRIKILHASAAEFSKVRSELLAFQTFVTGLPVDPQSRNAVKEGVDANE